MMKLPKPLQRLYDAWMAMSRAIGVVMGSIIFTVVWILVFGAYALCLKFLGLFAKKEPDPATYWLHASTEPSDFRHQF